MNANCRQLMRTLCLSRALVAIASVATICPAAAAKTRVFLLAGQSNMTGLGANAELTPPLSNPQGDVNFWDDAQDDWVSLTPGFGNGPTNFGPELNFGRTVADALPGDDVYLVKHATSGMSLAGGWAPAGGTDYAELLDRTSSALENLDNANIDFEISGMLWMQGESDALNAAHAAAYEANLTNFIAAVRSDLGISELPFILGRILPTFGTPADNLLVRNAQVDVANDDDNAWWIDTDNLQRVDPGHYGTQGQIDLGQLFAQQNLAAIPEPHAMLLLSCGGLALAARRRRRSLWM